MLKKYRLTPLLVALMTGSLLVSLWCISGCPGPPDLPSQLTVAYYVPSNVTTLHQMQTAPKNDYNQLIDIHDFKFTLNNFPCRNAPVTSVLVLVHSAPNNTQKRNSIRMTWGSKNEALKVLFLLGGVDNQRQQNKIEEENRRYKDIIQGSFQDAYRNMTYKHVMAFKYMSYHCPDSKYMLKTDDDIFVNSPALLDFVSKNISSPGVRKLIFCNPMVKARVIRSWRSKWRVSPREFMGDYYPTYCSGMIILYSPDVVSELYQEAQKVKYFWIDDVHITGVLAEKANFTHTPLLKLHRSRAGAINILEEDGNANNDGFLFAGDGITHEDNIILWNRLQHKSKSKR